MQFDIKALPTEAQQIRCQSPVVVGQFQRSLDRKSFDHVRCLAHELFEWHATNEFRQLVNRTPRHLRRIGIRFSRGCVPSRGFSNQETEPGRIFIGNLHRGQFNRNLMTQLIAQDRRKAPHHTVLTCVSHQNPQINAGSIEPAVE